MYIKRKPVVNYDPQAMIADLQESRNLLVELFSDAEEQGLREANLTIIASIDAKIEFYQQQLTKGAKR